MLQVGLRLRQEKIEMEEKKAHRKGMEHLMVTAQAPTEMVQELMEMVQEPTERVQGLRLAKVQVQVQLQT